MRLLTRTHAAFAVTALLVLPVAKPLKAQSDATGDARQAMSPGFAGNDVASSEFWSVADDRVSLTSDTASDGGRSRWAKLGVIGAIASTGVAFSAMRFIEDPSASGPSASPTKVYTTMLDPVDNAPTVAAELTLPAPAAACTPCATSAPDAESNARPVSSSAVGADSPLRHEAEGPANIDAREPLELSFAPTPDEPVTTTPEPATLSLMATGLVGIAGLATRRRKKTATA